MSAYNPFETPLIAKVEPLICQFCIRLGKMGQPLTKKTIIEFANSIISKTEYQDKVEAAKKLRGLEDESKLGVRWYQGFLSHHASLLTTSGTVVRDFKRRTWVTKENFENMYENVYKTMVEAGVAEEVSEDIQHKAGLPSKYRLTRPEYVQFVDETGCNTNQLNDGRVGNERFISPKDDSECGAPIGATTDIHFTVLPFVSGTGEAVMCTIIFKSDKDISEIPVSWKTGIDITVKNDARWTYLFFPRQAYPLFLREFSKSQHYNHFAHRNANNSLIVLEFITGKSATRFCCWMGTIVG